MSALAVAMENERAMTQTWTEEQRRAVEQRDGDLLLAAGAGSGKTSVLVERFVASVLEDDVGVGEILTITFTEKAAAEMRDRIRRRLRELGREQEAAATEGAFIATIHGFCARVLRAHALAAELDPGFAVLDEHEAGELQRAAFEAALEELAQGGHEAVDLIAAHTVAVLYAGVREVYAELRSRGRPSALPPIAPTPDLSGPVAELEHVAALVRQELGGVDRPGVRVLQALDRLARCGDAVRCADPWPGELDALALPKGNGAALTTPLCEAYTEALERVREICAHRQGARVHAQLDRLLRGFARRYEELKRESSALDFEDLELMTRALLVREPEIRARYRERFKRVMVDELQDTNRVQLELIEAVSEGNLFTVGDAQQAIYGFRNANVELFEALSRRRREEGRFATLTTNFRSRAEILSVLNAAFAGELGERFTPLVAGRPEGPGTGPSPGAEAGPRVELLVLDKGADWQIEGLASPWRLAEARTLAARVAELLAAGTAARDIVLLTRATTDLRTYERALEEQGVPTYLIGGRGYWGHPQVLDLLAYLRALANPLDQEALYGVLASPLVGVSLDTLVLLGAAAAAGRSEPWAVLREVGLSEPGFRELREAGLSEPGFRELREAGLSEPGFREVRTADEGETGEPVPPRLAEMDVEPDELARLQWFARWFAAERAVAARTGVEELIDRVLERTGYDRHVIALPAGRRRLANVRKLMRLGREHATAHGPDLRGFLDVVAARAGEGGALVRESEAPVEGEALDAVRLMTIHRSKGLEFGVVCVADLGRVRRIGWPLIRLGEDGRVGLRVSRLGGGKALPVLDYRALADERQAEEEAEERRLFYVAMTRAQERLIVSGAARLETWPEGNGGGAMGWVASALVPDFDERIAEGEGVTELGVAFRVMRGDDAARAAREGPGMVAGVPADPSEREELPARALQDAERDVVPAEREKSTAVRSSGIERDVVPGGGLGDPGPGAVGVSTLSYSALAQYRRCGYRFYVERVLGIPAREDPPAPQDVRAAGAEPGRPAAAVQDVGRGSAEPGRRASAGAERGVLAHALLEALDFRRPVGPAAASVLETAALRGITGIGEREAEEMAALVSRFAASEVCRRLGQATQVRREQRFTFRLDGELLITGAFDVLARERSGMLVLDYKSDRLDGASPVEVVEREYADQRLIYALAVLLGGAARVEVTHVFLEAPGDPVSAAFTAAEVPALRGRLRDATAGVRAAEFSVTPEPHRAVCAGCPAEGGLCSWPLAMTRRGRPDQLF